MDNSGDVPELGREVMDTSDNDDNDDDNSDTWDETEMINNQLTKCLFCPKVFTIVEDALEHATGDHGFNLPALKVRHSMDCYSFIKMINYLRQHALEASALMSCEKPLWEDDKYLKPSQNDDPWLMYDFDDLDIPPSTTNVSGGSSGSFIANAENGVVTLSEAHFVELQKKIQTLSAEVREKTLMLQVAAEDMKNMRAVTQSIMQDGDFKPMERQVQSLRLTEDQGYFDSYAHFSIHHEMLSDTVRTQSYSDAVEKNSSSMKDSTVLDVGCGSSILSMFAARAGASEVIGIDQSDIIYNAMDIVRENGLEKSVRLVKGRLEDTDIPVEKVDFIISEWMGYFLLFEGMLDSVMYARDKHLKPGGLLLPNRCSMLLVGVHDEDRHSSVVKFWNNVYGFKMNSLAKEVLKEPFIEIVPPEAVATSTHTLTMLDLMKCTLKDYDHISSQFSLEATRDARITALAGYFDTYFDLPVPVEFSTGPLATPTHWKQTLFYLPEPITLRKGEVLEGNLVCKRHRKEMRSLEVTISIAQHKYCYSMS